MKLHWIIPTYNEKVDDMISNLELFIDYSELLGFEYVISLCDGGSKADILHNTLQKVERLREKHVEVLIPFPILHPNKNLSIQRAFEKNPISDITIIIDSDWTNITTGCLDKLILPVVNGEQDIVMPTNTKSSGRINRLIVNPTLLLFLPELHKRCGFPLAGMMCGKSGLFKEVVQSDDYFWDWGGEMQLIIRPWMSNARFDAFEYSKSENKKRLLQSKIRDAYQVFTSILFELNVHDLLTVEHIEQGISLLDAHGPSEKKLFDTLVSQSQIERFENKSTVELFDEFKILLANDYSSLSELLHELYRETGRYEFVALRTFHLLHTQLLLGLNNSAEIDTALEIDTSKVESLDLKSFVYLMTIVIAATLHVALESDEHALSERFSSLRNLADTLDPSYTELAQLTAIEQETEEFQTYFDAYSLSSEVIGLIGSMYGEKNVDLAVHNRKFIHEYEKSIRKN
jgi:hypothetical protein